MIEEVEILANLLNEKENIINDFEIDSKVITKSGEKATILQINHLGLYIDLKGKLSKCILIQIDKTNKEIYVSPEDIENI